VGQDGGEELLATWPDAAEPFNNVTLAVLQHLDKEGLSPQQALQLSAAAFIPVAHASRLVAPQQLFLSLSGAALAPFAWEVPGQFVAHAGLLKTLGVQDVPRAQDLVRHMNYNVSPDTAVVQLQSLCCTRHSHNTLSQTHLACTSCSFTALLCLQLGGLCDRNIHVCFCLLCTHPHSQVHALWRFAGQLSGRRMNPNELAACMREWLLIK
jgi:hypothetical protein